MVDALDRNKAHAGPPNGFTDSRGISRVVLALLARQAIGGDELGCHQPHRMAVGLEQARPVVRARACFHADQARRQRCNELQQLAARHARTHQHRLACGIQAMDGKDVLGEINPNGNNGHNFPA